MRVFIALLLLVCLVQGRCQTKEEDMFVLIREGKSEEAIKIAREIINDPTTAAAASDAIGRAYADMGNYDSAIVYLEAAIKLDSERSYISGWAYAYLGTAHIMTGKKEQGISELNKAIALNKTRNSVEHAQKVLERTKLWPDWVTIDGGNIVYQFQDTLGWGHRVMRYIHQHENAYVKINRTFQTTLKQKLTLYVWDDLDLAQKILGKGLGFARPQLFVCHLHHNQTIGHEITHVLSYWCWGRATEDEKMTRFINEGLAVAFDQSKRDRYDMARKAIGGSSVHSVLDIWKDVRKTDEKLLYPVAGAFVTYLYSKSTAEQFRQMVKDQRIESAQMVLGKDEFDRIVRDFNIMIGLY